ncbi:5'-nucleotidase, lipoprotein e(P4) family [Celerinatantimonas yamalensis]|uniref:5'-nucleotidase, lipoprotein e(P4) family n=1 Tax=Celerinatantimonas yamalensis TaxID=559956 RepID=A0ABW9GC43_9GAMM
MFKQMALVSLTSLVLAGCAQTHMTQTTATPPSSYTTKDLNEQQIQGLLWMQKSAEYRALCFQAFNIAHLRVKQALNSDHSKPLAVVVDIDETVMNNLPYQAWLVGKNQGYSGKTWQQWVNDEQSTAIPGALTFLNYARENGIRIFYITNRSDKVRQATLNNLKQLGFPDANNDHLLMKTTTSNKGPRRDKVRDNYDVAVYMGDNLGDFTQKFDGKSTVQRSQLANQYKAKWGDEYVVLPNPIYGTWDGAVLHYRWGANATQKNELRHQTLNSWHPK